VDGRTPNRAVFVAYVVRLGGRLRTAAHRLLERRIRIVDLEHDVAHAVAVAGDVLGSLVIRRERGGQDEARASLLERIRGLGAASCLETAVGDLREPKRLSIEEGRLLRIAHPELDVVNLSQLERVVRRHERIIVNGGRG
jgi:hypothetical protein